MKRKIFFFLTTLVLCLCTLFGVCGCGEEDGAFYALSEAYENSWLTKEDLMSIAYYYNGGTKGNESVMGEEFVPQAKNPSALDESTEKRIKKAYLRQNPDMPQNSLEKVIIHHYYGTYGDSIAVGVTDNYYGYDFIFTDETIGGVTFYNYCAAMIWIFR